MTQPSAAGLASGPPGDDELAPVTVSHIRAIRRLLLAVAIWAVGASVVAVVALVEEDPPPAPRGGDLGLTTRIGEVERSLERRISGLEERIGETSNLEDTKALERRVRDLRRDTDDAVEAARDLNQGLARLQERVEALEAAPGGDPAPGGADREE